MKNKSSKIKKQLLGLRFVDGLIFKIILYALLIIVSFVYLFPLLHMLSYSFKSLEDLLNPMIGQVPSKLYFKNFTDAYRTLAYFKTMGSSLSVTLLPALIQTFIASLVGYGFARFEFKGKKIWLLLVVMTYIIPPQVVMIPRYVLFHQLRLLNSWLAIVVPATFGQGLNSAIFILIFYQFFKQIPKALDEAAQIDGAGRIYIYFKVAIPLSIPSFITSFLFSFVWYWNETYLAGLFLGGKVKTLQMRLQSFVSEYNAIFGGAAADFANEAIRMAATLLIILPMLIIYFILQRWFIEGIDKAGITGE
ncbi:MAG: carbohydrate ABC transporter permease [Acholeplasmatales bacterium]|jgi:multiple sugar transport system permease protein|nr:carbohydrate ABC transporter permease [Acholeplasmataceae bacterium]MDY0115761.1 carbohydrate ABC transporter permease [Acholeplasmatales bacterium]MCK9234594.1 carbohydrate ABC transporter permease [Acholeplasmataceae bacterium]MCK9289723.1 carbohydrate ABC transporter permease [Acholeplasmataceae bacterium]MCK9428192.1 carbohydrate ABC transporter permease [Acholeplasmataceae bacterium]